VPIIDVYNEYGFDRECKFKVTFLLFSNWPEDVEMSFRSYTAQQLSYSFEGVEMIKNGLLTCEIGIGQLGNFKMSKIQI